MLYVYNSGALANRIARDLGITSAVPSRQRIIRRSNTLSVHVNWGCASKVMRAIAPESTLNYNTTDAVSKLRAFRALSSVGIAVPPFSIDWHEMRGKYLARKDKLTGGKGIEVVEKGQAPTTAYDFVTAVIAKEYEFRIHVFRGEIICEQFKFIPQGSNVLIRSYDSGARFSNKSLGHHLASSQAEQARSIAIASVAACGLQFGAVDMILAKNGTIYVLEVNTAPGIARFDTLHDQLSTYDLYLKAFKTLVIKH